MALWDPYTLNRGINPKNYCYTLYPRLRGGDVIGTKYQRGGFNLKDFIKSRPHILKKLKNLRGGTVIGTKHQRGKTKGGKFSIDDLNPVKLVKKTGNSIRRTGTGLVKKQIGKIAKKQINKVIVKQGKRIKMSKKASDKLTNALMYTVHEQLDRKIK